MGFSITKCFISFRQRLEISKGKNTFHEWKRSKRPSMSYPRAKPTRFKPTLTSGKRLLWYFWRAMLEVKKKLVLIFYTKILPPEINKFNWNTLHHKNVVFFFFMNWNKYTSTDSLNTGNLWTVETSKQRFFSFLFFWTRHLMSWCHARWKLGLPLIEFQRKWSAY